MTDYTKPATPVATPPVIDPNASPVKARELAQDNGDSDFPGDTPDEISPDQGGQERPDTSPDEITPDKGDVVHTDTPAEIEIERNQRDGLGEQGMNDTRPLVNLPPD